MYTQYFGLEQEPFRVSFEGPGIYVGSQQATAISRLEKALAKPDAVATVTGPVGVGKTTLVSRALEVALPQARVARIERIRVGPDEVVELLLTKFGMSRQPVGAIQRFATFRRLLDECSDDGTPAVIVAEDARRLGIDALIELEAMTAAEGGNSGCANLVLMGDAQLPALLADPLLARLAQRMRTRQMIRPFSVDELRDYLKHCVHLAGGEFDAIFESGSVAMLHRCSDGIPRVVNNICETALSEAADAGAYRVTVDLLRDIAREVYAIDTLPPELVAAGELPSDAEGDDLERNEEFFSAGEFEPVLPGETEEAAPRDGDDGVVPAYAEEEELSVSEFTPNPTITIVDSRRVVAMTSPDDATSDHEAERESEAPGERPHDRTAADLTSMSGTAGEASANDPEGCEATLDSDADTHEVPILDNTVAVLKLDAESEELGNDDIPVLAESAGTEAVADDEQSPEAIGPERDESGIDTMTPEAEELTAALDELEQAISSANEKDVVAHDEPPHGVGAFDEAEPEITLDRSLDDQEPLTSELSRWQEELANAKGLEEMSDMLAETVFGDKTFDRIAAEAVERPPTSDAADAGEEPARLELEAEPPPPATDAALTGSRRVARQGATDGFEMSMPQRFELLRSLEQEARDRNVIEITLDEQGDAPGSSGEAPEIIESQIDTAITQSRMQLTSADIEKMKTQDPATDDEKQATGFFRLFKRSSKS